MSSLFRQKIQYTTKMYVLVHPPTNQSKIYELRVILITLRYSSNRPHFPCSKLKICSPKFCFETGKHFWIVELNQRISLWSMDYWARIGNFGNQISFAIEILIVHNIESRVRKMCAGVRERRTCEQTLNNKKTFCASLCFETKW